MAAKLVAVSAIGRNPMSNVNQGRITFSAVPPHSMMEPWRRLLRAITICSFIGGLVFIVALRREVVAQRGYLSSHTVPGGDRFDSLRGGENEQDQSAGLSTISNVGTLPFDIRQADRKFLDGLVDNELKDEQAENPFASGRSAAESTALGAGQTPVPRAELVINTRVVRRAELVAPSGLAKTRR